MCIAPDNFLIQALETRAEAHKTYVKTRLFHAREDGRRFSRARLGWVAWVRSRNMTVRTLRSDTAPKYRLRFLLQEFHLPFGITLIGRGDDCHITLFDPT